MAGQRKSRQLTERIRFSLSVDRLNELTGRAKLMGISRSKLYRRVVDLKIAEEVVAECRAKLDLTGEHAQTVASTTP